MTNILKDVWDDLNHGACWLPQDVFRQAGFDLHDLSPGHYQKEFGAGLEQLITIASEHLEKALCYTLLIPKQETGIRNFCLWAIGMAVLTLRKINQHRDFSTGNEVKISKRSVKATVLTSRLTASHNHILRGLFLISQIGQPGWTSIRNI
jgi:farnesyl-diphosphate farnesyltransferase